MGALQIFVFKSLIDYNEILVRCSLSLDLLHKAISLYVQFTQLLGLLLILACNLFKIGLSIKGIYSNLSQIVHVSFNSQKRTISL